MATRTFCDRCGTEARHNDVENIAFGQFQMTKRGTEILYKEHPCTNFKRLDLCKTCRGELDIRMAEFIAAVVLRPQVTG